MSKKLSVNAILKRGRVRSGPWEEDEIWESVISRRGGRPERRAIEVKKNGCRIWMGADNGNGHGMYNGQPVYRSFYVYFDGPIPEGKEIHHKCGNGRCVNPDHLQSLTRKEHRGSRLSAEDVSQIRGLAAEGLKGRQIAEMFGISESYASLIIRGLYTPILNAA